MVAWVDQRRIWLLAIGLVVAAVNIVLEISGQLSSLTVLLTFSFALLVGVVYVARAQRSSRLPLGLVVAVLLIGGDVVTAFVKPSSHLAVTVLIIFIVVVAFAVGLPIGLYTSSGLKGRDV